MHADDINFLVEHTPNNFVFGLKESKEKQTIYLNFLRPGSLDFFAALKLICNTVIVSITPTQAMASAVAAAHKAMSKKVVGDLNSALSISIDDHVAIAKNNAYIPTFLMKEKLVHFHWRSTAHMDKPVYLTCLKMKDVLATSSQHISNLLDKCTETFDADDDGDDLANMHYHFWQS